MTELQVEQTRQQHLSVEVQFALTNRGGFKAELPSVEQLIRWANHAYLAASQVPAEITIRVVSEQESQQLNAQYRAKDKPTNVLSFVMELQRELGLPMLGDVVICHDVVLAEARQQNKIVQDHYAHLVIHGILHLCGYDHQDDDDADKMESLEISLLKQLEISNPYIEN